MLQPFLFLAPVVVTALINVLVYGFHHPELVQAVRDATAGIANVVYWIGGSSSGECFDESIEAWHLGEIALPPDGEFEIDTSAKDYLAARQEMIHDQLRRNPACTQFTPEDSLNYATKLFAKFSTILNSKSVDIVFFQNLPHEGFELILYFAARFHGIKTTMCYQSVVPNRFFYSHRLSDFGHFQTCLRVKTPTINVSRSFAKDLFI
ncbi:MAG: hypothetical protein R3C03_02205 [Pirellulaceae bacterium]